MAKFIGKLASIGLKKEAVRGTAEATAGIFLPVTSIEFNDVIDQIVDESSVGVLAGSTDARIDTKKSEGSLEAKVGVNSIGHLLLAMFGASSPTNNADGTYTHAFTLANNSTHPSFTFFKYDPVQSYKYAYGVLRSLGLDAQVGQFFLASADILAKAGVEASVTPSFSSEANFLPAHMSVKMASAQSGLAGATALCAHSVSLNVDKGVIPDKCLGSNEFSDILNGIVKVSGSIEVAYKEKTEHDLMTADTAQALRIEAIDAGTTIGTGSANPTLTIDLYRTKIVASPISYDQSGLATQTIEFEGHYSIADSAMLIASLKNTTASY